MSSAAMGSAGPSPADTGAGVGCMVTVGIYTGLALKNTLCHLRIYLFILVLSDKPSESSPCPMAQTTVISRSWKVGRSVCMQIQCLVSACL